MFFFYNANYYVQKIIWNSLWIVEGRQLINVAAFPYLLKKYIYVFIHRHLNEHRFVSIKILFISNVN